LAAPFGHHTDGLDAMVKRQNIRALVLINPIGFFYDNGQPMGIMYDALRSLERYMNEQMKTGAMKVQVTAQADQERVQAETASQARQAEAQRDLEVKKAQYAELVNKQQAQADKAYEIQANVMQQQVTAEAVKVQQVEKEQQVKVQEAEILRREKELIATVLKGAEIERQRIETLAAAEKQRTIVEADGRASAIRAQGEAEAEIIFKKGDAEARAMNVKAEAYQEYNQAAVVDKLITGLPEVVKALASPLANVDKITVVSTGNGHSAGLNKITGDITEMAAQVPALFEALSGMQMSELLGKIRLIGDKAGKEEKPVAGGQ
jgi:flotillin